MKGEAAPGMRIFISTILLTTETCISFMREYGLLKPEITCERGTKMTTNKRKDISDGQVWNCNTCLKRKSIRTGSFFEKSKLSLINIMQVLYAFSLDFQVYQCLKLVPELDEKTVIEWYCLFRDVCSSAMLRKPIVLGEATDGFDTNIVEIDESLFGKKRKYHRGTGNQKYWVFGITERGTRNSVLQLVERRDRNTLLPIIKRYVKPGSTIFSDKWAAYDTLSQEGYKHLSVNHSEEFKSDEGCCTNAIEGLWGLAKLRMKKMKGILPSKIPMYLDEFMYRYKFGFSNGDIFYNFIEDVATFSPVTVIPSD